MAAAQPATARDRLLSALGVLLLTALLARGLAGENPGPPSDDPFMRALGPVGQAGRTAGLSVALAALSAATFAAAAGRRTLANPRALLAALALVAVGVAISSLVASHRGLAWSAGLTYAVLPISAVALGLALHAPAARRLAAAGLLAAVLLLALRCLEQHHVDLPLTRAQVQHGTLGDLRLPVENWSPRERRLFESRLLGEGVGGYFGAFANAAGGVLAAGLVALVGGALAARRALLWLLAGPAVALVGWALWLTDSRAAWIAAVVGLLALPILRASAAWLTASPLRYRRAVGIGVAIALAGVAAVALWARAADGLPDRSLTYRWHYAQGTAGVLADQTARGGVPVWLAGVGRENFQDFYARHKRPDSPEVVRSPHNLVLQAWAELGLAGLAGTLLFWGTVLLGRGPGGAAAVSPVSADEPPAWRALVDRSLGAQVLLVVGWAAAIFALRQWLVAVPAQAQWPTVLWFAAVPAVAWAVLFAAGRATLRRVEPLALALPLGVALAVLLLTNAADFNLFLPGPAALAMIAAGCVLAERNAAAGASGVPATPLRLAAGATLVLAVAGASVPGLVAPQERAGGGDALGRAGIRLDVPPAALDAGLLRSAVAAVDEADPADSRLRARCVLWACAGIELRVRAGRGVPDDLLAATVDLAASAARQRPTDWATDLLLADVLARVGSALRAGTQPGGAWASAPVELERLQALVRALAGRSLATDAALRAAGETVQVMTPAERAAAERLSTLGR